MVLRLRQGHRTRPFGLATALRSASRLVRGHPSLRHRKRLGQAEGIRRGLPGCRCETSGLRGIDSASRPQHPCVLACPPCTCERHHRRYATTDSQGARSRPQRPMPLWLWQEVQALPWSTEIVALTCVPRIACDPRRPYSSVHGKLVVQHRSKTKNVGTLPPLSSLNLLTIRDLRALIRRMSIENPLWGAPRIHGELLKLGFVWPNPASPSTWSRPWTAKPGMANLSV